MYHNSFVLNMRTFSVRLAVIAAVLAVVSVSLVTYAPGLAAPALHIASAGAIKVSMPLKELCSVPSYSQAEIHAMKLKSSESCTVSTSTSSSALDATKSISTVDPLSFSVTTLESMRWRNAARNTTPGSNTNPLSFSYAALESMTWRSAVGSSNTNPSSFSVAALESMRWRNAASSSTIPTALQRSWAAGAPSLTIEAAIYNSRRSAGISSSTNPSSFSVAALESMRWRLASTSQVRGPH